ncbi:lipid-transfer protein DIR1 [Carex littledalei]|uniref:Lipid-transfer protein DIR1 n=1 Tax=Carex littledalei TaxID=544730 RepID=A0A833VZE1_9POAL|nr:lipid-transfer protein DIR1 [Carex littledalei]
MNKLTFSILALLSLSLIISHHGKVSAMSLCKVGDDGRACLPAVRGSNPPPPTAKCCNAIRGADVKCLCSYISSSLVRILFGINTKEAQKLPGKSTSHKLKINNMNKLAFSIVVLLSLSLIISHHGMVSAMSLCKVGNDGRACLPAVRGSNPPPPTVKCCNAIRGADMKKRRSCRASAALLDQLAKALSNLGCLCLCMYFLLFNNNVTNLVLEFPKSYNETNIDYIRSLWSKFLLKKIPVNKMDINITHVKTNSKYEYGNFQLLCFAFLNVWEL